MCRCAVRASGAVFAHLASSGQDHLDVAQVVEAPAAVEGKRSVDQQFQLEVVQVAEARVESGAGSRMGGLVARPFCAREATWCVRVVLAHCQHPTG